MSPGRQSGIWQAAFRVDDAVAVCLAGIRSAAEPGADRRYPPSMSERLHGALFERADRWRGGARLPQTEFGERVGGLPAGVERGRRRRSGARYRRAGRRRTGPRTGGAAGGCRTDGTAAADVDAATIGADATSLCRGFSPLLRRRSVRRRQGDRLPARKRRPAVGSVPLGIAGRPAGPVGRRGRLRPCPSTNPISNFTLST